MRTTVAKSWRFDAAHQLINHDGKCAQPHGHTYTVTVGVAGEPQALDGRSSEGMVLDFATLDAVWEQLEPALDHQDLNDTLVVEVPVTTSELLADWLWRRFQDLLEPSGVRVEFVRVSETPSTYAEVRA